MVYLLPDIWITPSIIFTGAENSVSWPRFSTLRRSVVNTEHATNLKTNLWSANDRHNYMMSGGLKLQCIATATFSSLLLGFVVLHFFVVNTGNLTILSHRVIRITFYWRKSWWSMLPSRRHSPKSWWSIGSSGAMAPAPLCQNA